jgi:hypothetical protein
MNTFDPGPSFSQNLVNSLGGGLEALTQNKLQQIHNQQRRAGIQALGYSPQQAKQLSGLPDSLIQAELTNRAKRQQELASLDAWADEYGLPRTMNMQPPSNTQNAQPAQQYPQQTQNAQPAQQYAQQTQNASPGLPLGPGPKPKNAPLPPGLTRQEAARILQNREVRERGERALDLKEREVQSREAKESRLFSDPFIIKAQGSETNVKELKELRELTDQDLRAGGLAWLARYVGAEELGRNVPTEVAQKLVSRLKTNVGSAYPKGTRITNFLDATFQKTLPDLINSPEGMRLIIDLLIDSETPNILRNDARQLLNEEWKGRVPHNASDQIDKIIKPQLKALENNSMDLIVSTRLPHDELPGTELLYKGKKYILGEDKVWHSSIGA